MLPTDKGTRDLLPLIRAEVKQDAVLETEFDGAPAVMPALSLPAAPSASRATDDPAAADEDDSDGAGIAIKAPASAPAAFQVSNFGGAQGEHGHITAPDLALDVELTKTLVGSHGGKGGGHSEQVGIRDGGVQDSDDAASSPDAAADQSFVKTGDASGPIGTIDLGSPGGAAAPARADEDVDSIAVRQDAEVDQDARIIVNGYAGKVVARLHIDQDLMMDQDVEIDLTIDGDGHFSVLLDQDMRIDQEIDIDLNIFDVNGVLYVDLFLRDRISVEQDTTLRAHIGDGPPGGSVSIDQSLEMNQDVGIDIDIEDDLEERFVVKVDIDVDQDVEADQDGDVDITNHAGEVDMDVDAFQTASIDQETTVRIDFAAV